MMEISKLNEFESFQTNNKTALSPMLIHEVGQEFGGGALKRLCFPRYSTVSALLIPPPPYSLAKTRIIYGRDLRKNVH